MSYDTDNLRVALTGDVVTAPLGTTIPTTADAVWPAGWVDLGAVSEDGLSEDANDTVNQIRIWQDNAVARESKSWAPSLTLTLVETTEDVVDLYYNAPTISSPGGGGTRVQIGAPKPDRRMFGFTLIDGDLVERVIFYVGEVSERDSRSHNFSDPSGFPMTITAYPDPDHDGDYMERLYSSLPIVGGS